MSATKVIDTATRTEAAEGLTERAVKREIREESKSELKRATVVDFNVEEAEDNQKVSFSLKLPDDEVKYLVFTDEDIENKVLDKFLAEIGTTFTELHVEGKEVPVRYSENRGWGVLYGDIDYRSAYEGESTFFRIDNNARVCWDYKKVLLSSLIIGFCGAVSVYSGNALFDMNLGYHGVIIFALSEQFAPMCQESLIGTMGNFLHIVNDEA